MASHYYAVQYECGINTTTGQPNARTGRMSTAVNLLSFSKKINRDAWVIDGNCRKSVSKKEARSLHLGMSVYEFTEMLESMLDSDLDADLDADAYA